MCARYSVCMCVCLCVRLCTGACVCVCTHKSTSIRNFRFTHATLLGIWNYWVPLLGIQMLRSIGVHLHHFIGISGFQKFPITVK